MSIFSMISKYDVRFSPRDCIILLNKIIIRNLHSVTLCSLNYYWCWINQCQKFFSLHTQKGLTCSKSVYFTGVVTNHYKAFTRGWGGIGQDWVKQAQKKRAEMSFLWWVVSSNGYRFPALVTEDGSAASINWAFIHSFTAPSLSKLKASVYFLPHRLERYLAMFRF